MSLDKRYTSVSLSLFFSVPFLFFTFFCVRYYCVFDPSAPWIHLHQSCLYFGPGLKVACVWIQGSHVIINSNVYVICFFSQLFQLVLAPLPQARAEGEPSTQHMHNVGQIFNIIQAPHVCFMVPSQRSASETEY